ncbi:MAG: hypothetical protein WC979_01845 [Candidatus Pacearchaeota archaeon]|nr:hypothetical protein [Clostridia bacterium]
MTEREEALYKKFLPVGANELTRSRVRICVQCMFFNEVHRSHCPYCSCAWESYVKKPQKFCVKRYW